MHSDDLLRTAKDLTAPPTDSEKNRFTAVHLPGFRHFRIAKDSGQFVCFLVSTIGGESLRRLEPTVLENISVQYRVPCLVRHLDGTAETGEFVIVRCQSHDESLVSLFLRVMSIVAEKLGDKVALDELADAVNQLVELFRALSQAPRKTVQGLWAELLIVAESANPGLLIGSWHAEPGERFDFSLGDQRVEVKSSTDRVRQHHFSLEQLSPPAGSTVLVASMFVERSGGGTSLQELITRARERTNGDPQLTMRLDNVVALSLGASWQAALADRFDLQLGLDSLRYYDSRSLPTLSGQIPLQISDVRFKLNLGGCQGLTRRQRLGLGRLFEALPGT